MFKSRLLGMLLILAFFLAACGPATITPLQGQPQPLPLPADAWQLSFTQSGGFIGVQLRVEISSDGRFTAEDQRAGKKVTKQLDMATVDRLSSLVSSLAVSAAPAFPSHCADCFLYDIQLTSGARVLQVQADDTTLATSGAQELIGLLQQLRDDALKSQP